MAGADTNREAEDLEDDKEAFQEAVDHEAENRRLALEDIRFARLGEQWPAQVRAQREKDARPCLTINQLPAYIRGIVNDARQNKPGINVHPVDSLADPTTADIFNGLIRQIEQSSDAEVAYDTALDFAVTGGFGYFKINTRYATDDTFDQDIVIERVANPFSIYGDPNSTEADSCDWTTAFELQNIPKKVFKARWKGADAVSFDDEGAFQAVRDKSREAEDHVTIAARWLREDIRKEIVAVSMPDPLADPMLVQQAMALGVSDRLILDLETYEENAELFQQLGMTMTGSPREVPCWKVTQRILSGADVLEELDWAGKYIPIVPVYGEEINVEGIRHFRGLVRDAADLQRNFNYWRTYSTEMVALASKTPWIGKTGTFATDQAKWDTANVQNWPYIEYDNEAPIRPAPPAMPAAAIQEAANASDDMRRIMGLLNPQPSADNESSGRAILARQRQSDIANFHFIDNLSRAIRCGGRIVLDLIPKVYSTQRVIRIMGPDGQQKAAMIGPQQQQAQPPPPSQDAPPPANLPVGASPPAPPQQGAPPSFPGLNPALAAQLVSIERIFDLTVGKYDLTVQAGPSYSSLREELNTVLVELIQAAPQLAGPLAPFIIKTLDMPDAEEVVGAIQQAMQGHGDPQAAKQAQQMQSALQAAHDQLGQLQQKYTEAQADADQARLQAQQAASDNTVKMAELQLKSRELDLKTFEAQTDRIQAQTDSERARRESLQAGVVAQPFAA